MRRTPSCERSLSPQRDATALDDELGHPAGMHLPKVKAPVSQEPNNDRIFAVSHLVAWNHWQTMRFPNRSATWLKTVFFSSKSAQNLMAYRPEIERKLENLNLLEEFGSACRERFAVVIWRQVPEAIGIIFAEFRIPFGIDTTSCRILSTNLSVFDGRFHSNVFKLKDFSQTSRNSQQYHKDNR
jgi:hypothetical protein